LKELPFGAALFARLTTTPQERSMPKVQYTTKDGRVRIVDERVAKHLQSKGRGTYMTRDLVAQPITPPAGSPPPGPSGFVAPIDPAVVTAQVPEPAPIHPAAVTVQVAEPPAPEVAQPEAQLTAKERRELARAQRQNRGGEK
jgi:hypothetical protein